MKRAALLSGCLLVAILLRAFPSRTPQQAPACHPDEAGHGHAASSAGPYLRPNHRNVEVGDEPGRVDGERVKTVLFKDIAVDRLYPSMRGPWTRQYVPLRREPGNRHVWITRYRAEVLDQSNMSAAQEFMCHTKLDIVRKKGDEPARLVASQFVISQGQKEIEFPKGFALRVEDEPDRQLDVNVMVLNNNHPKIDRRLAFKATIGYMDERAARAEKLQPLFLAAASVSCPTSPGAGNSKDDPVCAPASEGQMLYTTSDGRKATGHWYVPPGRQVVRTPADFVRADTTIHFIMMHVHPYAESFELRDVTAGKTVWKGKVGNDPASANVLSTDHYSSAIGLPVYKNHRYELISIYNNPTGKRVDAMASLWVYMKVPPHKA